MRIFFDMKYYGIKRVGGKGYENNYLVVRKRRKREYAFFLFLLPSACAVFAASVAICFSVLLMSASCLSVFYYYPCFCMGIQ